MDTSASATPTAMPDDAVRIEVAAATETGRRETNADAYLVDEAAGVFAVADGVGDAPRSSLVARIALEAVRETFRPPWSSFPIAERSAREAKERLVRGVLLANARLHARRVSERLRTATTFAGVALCAEGLCIAHAGDSRVYVFRPSTGKLVRATEDNTVMSDAFGAGMTCAVAMKLPKAHALTSAVGLRHGLELRPVVHRWAPGDMVLVCTDGVSDRLDSDGLTRALLEPGDVAATTHRLVERARAAGGHDNATAVVLRRLEPRPLA